MKSNLNFLVAVTCSIYIVLEVHVTLFCAFCTQAFFVKQPFSLAEKMMKASWNDVLLSFYINFSLLFLHTPQFSIPLGEQHNAILNHGGYFRGVFTLDLTRTSKRAQDSHGPGPSSGVMGNVLYCFIASIVPCPG